MWVVFPFKFRENKSFIFQQAKLENDTRIKLQETTNTYENNSSPKITTKTVNASKVVILVVFFQRLNPS